MGKSLIITEKPSVAMEYAKVLGVHGRENGFIENDRYVITWCVGHLVGMVYPEKYDIKYAKWNLNDLPFLPEKYKYDVISSVKDQYKIVHKMLMRKDIDRVYWAGDSGKEGQTIEENIRRFSGVRKGMEELRVWIDSQTEEEIRKGLRTAKPMSEYRLLGESGTMRAIEDYAMGINFSRVMSLKYGHLINKAAGTKSYSAIAVGRVMTCVLGMVVTRERDIRNFKETPFYRVLGTFSDADIEAEWKAVEGSSFYQSPLLYKENGFKTEKDAKQLITDLRGKEAKILQLEKFVSKKKAPLLFNLAELQAECAKRFKISPDETLQIAQELYEKKLTTYPRTDARVLSSAVAKEIHKNVLGLQNYSKVSHFVSEITQNLSMTKIMNTMYVDDSKVTDHYAIIPTGQLGELTSLNSIQNQVFELICRRFLAIFYPEAEYLNVKMTIGIDKESFFSSAKVLKTSGFLFVLNDNENKNNDKQKDNKLLAAAETLRKGQIISANNFSIGYGKTSPPKRYTSGSIILAMENAGQLIEDEELREQIKGSGIGTSATRAEIIKKLVRIGYLNLNKKTQILTPESFGEMVYEVVSLTVPDLLNPKMSASWEKGLDGITNGKVTFDVYKKTLDDYIRKETEKMIHQNISEELVKRIHPFALCNVNELSFLTSNETTKKIPINTKCPSCGKNMVKVPFGYACEDSCGFTIGKIAGKEIPEDEVKKLLLTGRTNIITGFCSKKGTHFDAYLCLTEENGKYSLKFEFPDKNDLQHNGTCTSKATCPKCGGAILTYPKVLKCSNECGFVLFKTMGGKELSEKDISSLLTSGQTKIISGFKSKNGNKFSAKVKLGKDFTQEFVFK